MSVPTRGASQLLEAPLVPFLLSLRKRIRRFHVPGVRLEQLKGDFMQTNAFAQVLHGLAVRGFAITNTIPSPELNPDHRLAVISQNDQKRLIVVVPVRPSEGRIRHLANWEKVEYYILQKQQRAYRTDFIFVSETDEFPIEWSSVEA